MRTAEEIKNIDDKAHELAKLLSKQDPINLRHDKVILGTIEVLLNELDIPNMYKAS